MPKECINLPTEYVKLLQGHNIGPINLKRKRDFVDIKSIDIPTNITNLPKNNANLPTKL